MISIDLYTGTIKVDSNKAPGTYNIKVYGELPHLPNAASCIITIKIATLPKFMPEPAIIEIIEVKSIIQKEI